MLSAEDWEGAGARMRNALRLKLLGTARAYRAVLGSGPDRSRDAQIVLADLRDFTFAEASTFNADPLLAARNAGRREVWLRIVRALNLNEAELVNLLEVDDGL